MQSADKHDIWIKTPKFARASTEIRSWGKNNSGKLPQRTQHLFNQVKVCHHPMMNAPIHYRSGWTWTKKPLQRLNTCDSIRI